MSAAAAVARMRMMHEEEERLSQYSAEELAQGWEFKIVRACTAAFRNPAVMEQVCAEEAQCGWVLVEKFDDYRLRFKRPASARSVAAPAGIDPYRTRYGISQGALTGIILLCTFGGIGVVVLLVFALVR